MDSGSNYLFGGHTYVQRPVCWRGPSSSCRSDAPQGQSLAHVFAATSRRVPCSGGYAIGYTNTGFTKMRDADKGRPTRCSQCRITSASSQHTRSPSAEHIFTIARNCGKEMLCIRFDLILLRTFCRVWHLPEVRLATRLIDCSDLLVDPSWRVINEYHTTE